MQDYLAMFANELRGQAYSKTEHRMALLPKLRGRSESSIEFKHQNISAILIEMGLPYIAGYKPASNYQKLLREVVESAVAGIRSPLEQQLMSYADAAVSASQRKKDLDWQSLVTDAPQVERRGDRGVVREPVPRRYDFAERESRNRSLGEAGEELVLEYERYRFSRLGRDDLVKEIEWTSKVRGDGAGYDIRSFCDDGEKERFIEVKSTNSGKYQPFYISDNELAFADEHKDRYALYRVYQFRDDPRLFTLTGELSAQLIISPKLFRAGFSY